MRTCPICGLELVNSVTEDDAALNLTQTKEAGRPYLSQPAKMPGVSHGLPAGATCRVGSALSAIPGSVCSGCYADEKKCGTNFSREEVKAPRHYNLFHLQKALHGSDEDRENWVSGMVSALKEHPRMKKGGHMRWHDSGDLAVTDDHAKNVKYLGMIAEVAKRTPEIKHWVPTKEHGVVSTWSAEGGKAPANLTIRYSAPMFGDTVEKLPHGAHAASSAGSGKGYLCPASHTENDSCEKAKCRACLNRNVQNVDYKIHGRVAMAAVKKIAAGTLTKGDPSAALKAGEDTSRE